MLEVAGRDATVNFHDVGHSKDAKELAEQYAIGYIKKSDDFVPSQTNISGSKSVTWSEIIFSPTWSNFLIPVALSVIVYSFYTLSKSALNKIF